MKVTQLQELLTSNTNEGVVDFDAIAKNINDDTNLIRDNGIEKYKTTAVEEMKGTVVNDFLKSHEFENVDQFTSFVTNAKSSSSEVTAKATRLEKELKDWQGKYTGIESQFNEVNNKYTNETHKSLARGLGVKDDMIDYALFEATKNVTDEIKFDDAMKSLIEAKPSLVSGEERLRLGEKKPNNPTPPSENAAMKLHQSMKRHR